MVLRGLDDQVPHLVRIALLRLDHRAHPLGPDLQLGLELLQTKALVDGAPVLREGVGEASIELAVPNAPSTIFRIGSCSKQFTALAILLLADRGVLRVSDSLGALMYDET